MKLMLDGESKEKSLCISEDSKFSLNEVQIKSNNFTQRDVSNYYLVSFS